jgi:hypothetical protein
MTLMLDQPVSAGATLYPRGMTTDAERRSAEDFYQQGAGRTNRAVTIRVVGPDGSLRCDWLASHMETQLNELLRLDAGWDGGTADPVSMEAVNSVVAIVGQISSDLAVPPFVFPLPDGGLQIEWHAGREAVEIEVDGEGAAHLLVTAPDGTIVVNDELMPHGPAEPATARRAVERLSTRLLRAR